MNNIIVLGKVTLKSSIHFDYIDKLKAYFKIRIVENENVFNVVICEKYINIDNIDMLYKNTSVNSVICIFGNMVNKDNIHMLICRELYVLYSNRL